jgi:hypothetical protein
MMRTKLAIVAVSGFVLSAVCLGGAFAVGGGTLGSADFNLGGFGLPSCGAVGSAAATSRTLPWNGNGDRVAVALPGNAYYRPGSGDQLVVKGDPRIISHVYVRDGVVGIDCNLGGFLFNRSVQRIEVTLPGRPFKTFALQGSGDMKLAGLSQPDAEISLEGSGNITADGKFDRLKVVLDGSGDITATGSTGDLNLNVEGSGDAKLGGLTAKNADVSIDGSGDVEVAPQGAASVTISDEGSGDVKAQGTTDKLKVEMQGSGDIKLGGLAAKSADVHIAGSGEAEIAPEDRLNVSIGGSGDVTLRKEPKNIDVFIGGSGEVIHSDGRREDRRSHERHARAEAIAGSAIAAAMAHDSDADAHLARAQAEFSAKIKERVARELEKAGVADDDR